MTGDEEILGGKMLTSSNISVPSNNACKHKAVINAQNIPTASDCSFTASFAYIGAKKGGSIMVNILENVLSVWDVRYILIIRSLSMHSPIFCSYCRILEVSPGPRPASLSLSESRANLTNRREYKES